MDIHDATPAQADAESRAQHDWTARQLALRVGNPELQALRAQHPFVSIAPLTNSVVTGVAGVNAIDVEIPQGTKMLFVTASDEIYISRNGRAQVPANDANGAFQSTGSVDPRDRFLYVEEIRSVSIVAVNANTRVSISCIQQL